MSEFEEWEKPPQQLTEASPPKTVLDVVNDKEQQLLQTDEVNKMANTLGGEKIKSEFAEKAAEIKAKNIETAEKVFASETKNKRLKQLKAKLDTEHKYEMSIIKENGRHYAMLDKRKKMTEKYAYLYGENEPISYSLFVNKIRSFTHSVSKLDKTVKQALKISVFVALGIAAMFLLKLINVL